MVRSTVVILHVQQLVILSRLSPQVLHGGLHLDFGVLQWSKLVEIRNSEATK